MWSQQVEMWQKTIDSYRTINPILFVLTYVKRTFRSHKYFFDDNVYFKSDGTIINDL